MSEDDERLSDATELAKVSSSSSSSTPPPAFSPPLLTPQRVVVTCSQFYGQSLPSTRPQTAASRPQTASTNATSTPAVGPSPAGGRAKSAGGARPQGGGTELVKLLQYEQVDGVGFDPAAGGSGGALGGSPVVQNAFGVAPASSDLLQQCLDTNPASAASGCRWACWRGTAC